jgi:hypothetical protein
MCIAEINKDVVLKYFENIILCGLEGYLGLKGEKGSPMAKPLVC